MANMHHDVEIDNPDVHHEESDVNIKAILQFAFGLFVVAAVVHVLIYFMFVFLSNREASADSVREYPLSVGQEDRLPPEPRLQTNPKQDLRDLRTSEEQILNGYRWIDRNNGVVGIPVNEAMKLTLQRGLPSRPQGAAPAASPAPADSAAPKPSQERR